MNRPFPKFAKALILAVGLALTCSAQPSLQEVWKRHDAFAQKVIGEGDGKAKLIAVSEQLFVGKAGNKVRGWDSGNVNAPAILWWGGGPGSTFDLAYLWKEFENPSKFRHMGIDQPGTHKLLVPFNGGHWGFDGPDKAAREKCGLVLTPKQERQLALATALHFGNDMLLIGAALDSLGETAIAY